MTQAATLEEVWTLFREADKRLTRMEQEAEHRAREFERNLDRVSRNVDALTGKWGKFVENMVAPACERLFAERGIPVHKVSQRVRARLDDGRSMEVDVVVVNSSFIVLVEVKSTLTVRDIKDHMHRLKEFKTFFPEYGDRKVLGAVAGMVVEELADRFAEGKGLFVIRPAGDTVRLSNSAGFRPREW